MSPASRRFALPGLLASTLLCHGHARAQQQVQPAANEQVIQAWQQANPGGAEPTLARQEDGSTRIEWKVGDTLDRYNNSVQSAGGYVNTPLRSGAFFTNTVAADLRVLHREGAVDHLQLGMTHSNDRAVLSQASRQVNNVQLSRAGAGYLLAAGDVAPNFSSLGSALGVRGLLGQRQFGTTAVSGFTGLVADSWEALDHRVARSQPIRDVHGIKLEQALGTALRAYATTQGSEERAGSGDAVAAFGTARHVRSDSVGFQYERGQFSLAGETARSSVTDSSSADRDGDATVADASWRLGSVLLRAGSHLISPGFVSLSAAAQPGIRETYAGAEWAVAPWGVLTGELRRSRATTLATGAPSVSVETDALATGAVVNFGPSHPGWALSAQHVAKRTTDAAGRTAQGGDFSSTASYSNAGWNASVRYSANRIASAEAPETDSRQHTWMLGGGRVVVGDQADTARAWSVATNVSGSAQLQHLAFGQETATTAFSLGLRGQHAQWGAWNLVATGGYLTRPDGGPRLRQRGLQADASRTVLVKGSLKAYLRSNQRNAGDALLATREDVAGIQFTYDF